MDNGQKVYYFNGTLYSQTFDYLYIFYIYKIEYVCVCLCVCMFKINSLIP
jgi:hypothetical protein